MMLTPSAPMFPFIEMLTAAPHHLLKNSSNCRNEKKTFGLKQIEGDVLKRSSQNILENSHKNIRGRIYI